MNKDGKYKGSAQKGTKIVTGSSSAMKAGTSGGKTRNGGGQNGKSKC